MILFVAEIRLWFEVHRKAKLGRLLIRSDGKLLRTLETQATFTLLLKQTEKEEIDNTVTSS